MADSCSSGILAAVVFLVGGIFLTATKRTDAYPTTWSLTVPGITQGQSNWCWAASIRSIMGYHGVWDNQCNIVEKVFPPPPPCPNVTALDWQAQQALSNYGFQSTLFANAISFSSIVSEIYYASRPFYAGWSWIPGPWGHAVVVSGYDKVGDNYVEYMNPANGGFNLRTYDWFRNGPGHVWNGTIYRIR